MTKRESSLQTKAEKKREPMRQTLLPLSVGIAVVVLAAILNHSLFTRNIPSLALASYETTAILRDGGAASPREGRPRSFGDAVMQRLADMVEFLDGRAAEIMGFIGVARSRDRESAGEAEVVVVAVDEASLNRIGSWSWSRRILARIMDKFRGAKAVGFDILFYEPDQTSLKNYISYLDALYGVGSGRENVTVDPELIDNDLYFGQAISEMESVLSVFFFSDPVSEGSFEPLIGSHRITAKLPDGKTIPLDQVVFREADDVLLSLDAIRKTGSGPRGEGFMNLFPDHTGAVRSVPLFIQKVGDAARDAKARADQNLVYPSLPLEMARLGLRADHYIINLTGSRQRIKGLEGITDDGVRYTMKSVSLARSNEEGEEEILRTIPVDELGDMMVSTIPRPDNIKVCPAWEVLAGLHDGAFAGKYVLFDVTAAGIGNVRASMHSAGSVPSVFIHAYMVSAMLRDDFVSYSFHFDYYWQQALIILAGVAVSLGFFYGTYLTSFLVFLGVIFFLTTGNYLLLFRNGTVAGLAMPIFASIAALAAQFFATYLVMGRDRKFIRNAFSLNVSPSILSYLETHPDRMSALAGENRNMTVLFSDIRGFTAMSENMTATDLATFLNEYLTPMSDIVMQNLGTVDKFMGDAIMAFWNAPTDDPDHAKNAARCALSMQARIDELQTGWSERGLPRLAIGCGINSGPMFAGYMGSEQRKNYTVMGDNVNIASRLEGLNKIYSSGIIIAQSTKNALGPTFFCRVLDKVRVSGRHGPIVIYELLGEGIQEEARHEEIASFERVFELYQMREFESAAALLQEILFITPHPLYDMYMDRFAVYSALPPPDDWDGVFTVTRK